MSKRIIIISAIFLSSLGLQKANGQAALLALIFGDQVASEQFNLSLELGWNYSTISNFEELKRANAVNFGLGTNFKLSEKFYLSPTVYFLSKRSLKFNSYSLNTGNDILDMEFQNTSGESNISYIDIPVLLWYQMNKVRLGIGPQVSFLTNSTLLFKGADGDFTQNVKDQTNSTDYGIMASVSYELGKARRGKGLFIQLRYYQGFTNIYKNPINVDSNVGSYFSIHLSLPFITDELAQKKLEGK